MAVNLGSSDSDLYFDIEDEKVRDCLRQLFDNNRLLNAEVKKLKQKVFILEIDGRPE